MYAIRSYYAHIIYSTIRKNSITENGNEISPQFGIRKTVKGSFFGLLAGIITGTFGTSGTAPVIAGLFTMEIPLKLVIGTSLLVILANTVFAIGAHFLVGHRITSYNVCYTKLLR